MNGPIVRVAASLCWLILSAAYALEGKKLAEMSHKTAWKPVGARK